MEEDEDLSPAFLSKELVEDETDEEAFAAFRTAFKSVVDLLTLEE